MKRIRFGFKLPPLPMMQFVRRFRPPAPVLDPGNDPAFRSSYALRLVRKLPVVFVNAPERVVLNLIFVLIGLTSFVADQPGSIISRWPQWVVLAWGMSMSVGGASVLLGMFRNLTSVERLGYVLVAPACIIYAVSALWLRGLSGVPVFLIFIGLAASKMVRMIISTAERDMTIEYGQRMDRDLQTVQDESQRRMDDQ